MSDTIDEKIVMQKIKQIEALILEIHKDNPEEASMATLMFAESYIDGFRKAMKLNSMTTNERMH